MRKCCLSAAAAFLAALLGPAPAAAQESDFFESASEYFKVETIEGVSKHAETPTETPATVTVINRADLDRYGFRTVAEVMNFASLGYFAHGDRRYGLVGGRGLFFFEDFNTRILVMLNGHAVNEPWSSFGEIERAMLVPMDLVERVEIVYGPSSLLYGGYSLYGIVNVVTRTASALPAARVRVTGGTWNTGEVVASYGASGLTSDAEGNSTEWSVLAAAGYYRSHGEDFDLPRFDAGYAVDLQGGTIWGGPLEDADYTRAPFAFLHAKRGGVSFLSRIGYRLKGLPLAPFGAVYESIGQELKDARGLADLRWDRPLTSRTDLSLRAFADWYDYYEQDPYADSASYPGEPGYFFVSEATSRELGGEARLTHRRAEHFLTVGAEYRQRSVESFYHSVFFGGGEALGSRKDQPYPSSRFLVLYLQEEWRPREQVSVVAGGNFADTEPGGSKAQPRLGVIYKPRPALALKLLYGRGFRPPNLFEASYQDFVTRIPNPNLRSESISSSELSLIWNARAGTTVQAYAFRSRLEGLIRSVRLTDVSEIEGGVVGPTGVPADLLGMQQYQSTGDVRSSGLGSAVRFRSGRTQAYLNVAYAHARLERGLEESELPASPSWLGSAGVSHERGRWTGGLSARYVGTQSIDPSRGAGEAGGFVEANVHAEFKTRVVYPVTFRLDVMNLFDAQGELAASTIFATPRLPIEGRRATLGLEVRF